MTNPAYTNAAKVLALIDYGQVSPRLFDMLFSFFGSLDKILDADSDTLAQFERVSTEQAELIALANVRLSDAQTTIEFLAAREIKAITSHDQDYPRLLTELNDPPPMLFVRGQLPDSNLKSVALAGSRRADHEAIQMTTALAQSFARDSIQVIADISGAVAAAAHLGSGGNSFAVIEAGFDHLADTDLMPLAIDIANNGGVISEHLPAVEPDESSWRQSNRLIAGLAQGIVVTAAYTNSRRTLDLLSFCSEIGKLAFFFIDPEYGAFADEKSLEEAVAFGAIPIEGFDHLDDIIRSLV